MDGIFVPKSVMDRPYDFGDQPMRTTHVAFLLDRSGSMEYMKEEAVKLFNEQRQAILERDEEAGRVLVSLMIFDHEKEWLYQDVPIEETEELLMADFRPRGGTHLYDAIGTGISHLSTKELPPAAAQQRANGDNSLLLIIITDGREESGITEFTHDSIKALMDQKSDRDDWTITLVGAESISPTSASLGMRGQAMSTLNFAGNEGFAGVRPALSAGTQNYFAARSRGIGAMSYAPPATNDDESLTDDEEADRVVTTTSAQEIQDTEE